MTAFSWPQLLCTKRLSQHFGTRERLDFPEPEGLSLTFFRNEIERDHDRILFSTPFRRLGDKTQVFPLESIESIRTRLTHSYEVANLARSIGVQLAEHCLKDVPDAIRVIPSALGAVGLVHDLGNPPFGHQGEKSIRSWFESNENRLFCNNGSYPECINTDIRRLTPQHKKDFLHFEGNAQTLRLVTKLQVVDDDLGLNLTMCTLASLMKYVVASNNIDKDNKGSKKNGYFSSEQEIVKIVRDHVGLTGNARHPLALIMEACDDIAYSVLDAEDAVKKGLVSFNDLMSWLETNSESHDSSDPVITNVCEYSREKHRAMRRQNLHPAELDDVAMQIFRTRAIQVLILAVLRAFEENYPSIMDGSFGNALVDISAGRELCNGLKLFDRVNAYNHRSVLALELNGHNLIHRLMDFLWQGISRRTDYNNMSSSRQGPFAEYVYSRISRNYRRVFEKKIEYSYTHEDHPIRYRELQLLTDMISGMTDQFCVDLYDDLQKHEKKMRPIDGTFA